MNFKEMYREAMKREMISNERRAEIVRDIRAGSEPRPRRVRRPLLTVAVVSSVYPTVIIGYPQK